MCNIKSIVFLDVEQRSVARLLSWSWNIKFEGVFKEATWNSFWLSYVVNLSLKKLFRVSLLRISWTSSDCLSENLFNCLNVNRIPSIFYHMHDFPISNIIKRHNRRNPVVLLPGIINQLLISTNFAKWTGQ